MEPEQINLFGLEVNPAAITAFIVTAVILLACVILRIFVIPKFQKRPKGLQLLLEGLVGYFDKSATSELHRHGSFVGPYVFTAAVFIALTTLCELIGLRPAFSSINTCLAFGLTTFIVINILQGKKDYPLLLAALLRKQRVHQYGRQVCARRKDRRERGAHP
jgi:F0F1-type ATP synthase membrane subunit a